LRPYKLMGEERVHDLFHRSTYKKFAARVEFISDRSRKKHSVCEECRKITKLETR